MCVCVCVCVCDHLLASVQRFLTSQRVEIQSDPNSGEGMCLEASLVFFSYKQTNKQTVKQPIIVHMVRITKSII